MGKKRAAVIALLMMISVAPVLAQTSTTTSISCCEGDFDCDGDQDGADASAFKADFGRSLILNPCTNETPCNGDFSCNGSVDGTDGAVFKTDFGRSPFKNPCPACASGEGCTYTTTSSTTTTCDIDIVYGRPGRRTEPYTCNDIIDFTICSDCSSFDPSCLVWMISPPASWLAIDKIDDCTWRLLIGDYCCEDPDNPGAYAITVTDTCNNASDTVIINIL
jgi:hypothetical protein